MTQDTQTNAAINLIVLAFATIFLLEVLPVIALGMIGDLGRIKELLKEYKRLKTDKNNDRR